MEYVNSLMRASAIIVAAAGALVLQVPAAAAQTANPLLITYGNQAAPREGDPDHRQLVRFSVPVGYSGNLHVRVYDADTGGAVDEEFLHFDTVMRYALYAASADLSDGFTRDEDGFLSEQSAGRLLGEISIAKDEARDGRWTTLFSIDAKEGETIDGRREFFLLVEGSKGDDGNVFDVFVSTAAAGNASPNGLRLYSFIPTVRVPDQDRLTEVRLKAPADAAQLDVGNFDTSKGDVVFSTPFRTLTLDSTLQGEWVSTRITLRNTEKDNAAAVTFGGGREIPNDITFYVADLDGNPLPLDLPPRSVKPNKRPEIALSQKLLSCGNVELDASRSADPEATDLTFRWRFGNELIDGPIVRRSFEPGTHRGRLEVFDGSDVVGRGRARDFAVFVKAPPIASFAIPARIPLGKPLVLDAYASRPPAAPGNLSLSGFEWDLGDESSRGGEKADVIRHTYLKPGVFDVRLTVKDDSENPCDTASMVRRVIVDGRPMAQISVPKTAVVGQRLTFDATDSDDADGAITNYKWTFGDGQSATKPRVDHAFHNVGEYEVSLLVSDDSGFRENTDISRTTVRVTQAPNIRPVAQAGGDRDVRVGEPITFDGIGSSDPDGEIIGYAWDFGDTGSGRQATMDHTFLRPGRYSVTLTVTDDSNQSNATATDSLVVMVQPAPNIEPSIVVKAASQAVRFLPVTFDAGGSRDPDGNIIEYAWDFGDGHRAVGAIVDHAFSEPGNYQVKLVLKDDHQPQPGTSEAAIDIEVLDATNRPPVAILGPDREALTGENILFDASGSSDPDGQIISYIWDFGDGQNSTGIAPSHTYQSAGEYLVSLTVSDSHTTDPATITDTMKVVVRDTENQAPTAVAGADLEVQAGTVIAFDGTKSMDPDGNIVAYIWTFGTGETSIMARPSYTFHDQGTYTVRLSVTDDSATDPKSAADELTVTVRAAADGAAK